jgi:hypothetical protein
VKPERRRPVQRNPARGLGRPLSRPAIDRLLPPDLQSRPLVADWLAFLAELLAAEAMRDFVDEGGIE